MNTKCKKQKQTMRYELAAGRHGYIEYEVGQAIQAVLVNGEIKTFTMVRGLDACIPNPWVKDVDTGREYQLGQVFEIDLLENWMTS